MCGRGEDSSTGDTSLSRDHQFTLLIRATCKIAVGILVYNYNE